MEHEVIRGCLTDWDTKNTGKVYSRIALIETKEINMNSAESVLDQKFRESYQQIERERKRSGIAGGIEGIALVIFITAFVILIKFVFWGGGFKYFAKNQHEFTVYFLRKQPGPQGKMVELDIAQKGHISLWDYRRYVEIANQHKQNHQ